MSNIIYNYNILYEQQPINCRLNWVAFSSPSQAISVFPFLFSMELYSVMVNSLVTAPISSHESML